MRIFFTHQKKVRIIHFFYVNSFLQKNACYLEYKWFETDGESNMEAEYIQKIIGE